MLKYQSASVGFGYVQNRTESGCCQAVISKTTRWVFTFSSSPLIAPWFRLFRFQSCSWFSFLYKVMIVLNFVWFPCYIWKIYSLRLHTYIMWHMQAIKKDFTIFAYKNISTNLYKFYFSNTYLFTYVVNRRVKKYDILQKTLQIEIN